MLSINSKYGEILVNETTDRNDRGGRDNTTLTKVKYNLEEALETVKIVSQSMMDKIGELAHNMQPEEVVLKLGLTFTAEAGVVIAKAGTEGVIELEITWKKS